MNSTLGFGEILAINLDRRTDRRNSLCLISAISSLKVTRIRASTPSDIEDEPLFDLEKSSLRPAEIACWRSHVNAWRHVIESGVETAVILEDDADWHVNIKEQFALLSKELLKNGAPIPPKGGGKWTPKKQRASDDFLRPYGRGWEVLIFGQLWSEWQADDSPRPSFTYRDTAGPKPDRLQEDFLEEMTLHGIEAGAKNMNMRVVAQSAGFVGLTGYAITRDAAQKLLYRIGIVPSDSAVDIQIRDLSYLCEVDTLVITPPLVSPWRTGGPGDTDIQEELFRVNGIGEGSVRREMARRWGADLGIVESDPSNPPAEAGEDHSQTDNKL
ncbi:MAG: hypothetical protein M1840_007707 [Geoglossum simile]|nr:MAG: hypothetical protein M1840_007707 [Geoglossum simile]